MLVVIREDGLNVPAAFCDFCDGRIEEARQGSYCWNPEADGGVAQQHHLHKRCHRAWESSNHTVNWYAIGLSVLPIYLAGALNVDRERAMQEARMLASR